MKRTVAFRLSFVLLLTFSLFIGLSGYKALAEGEPVLDFRAVFDTERILDFQSTVNINKKGVLNVTERIQVYANGNQIKHGIYRDFPTKYGNIFANVTKGFKVLSVKRDGRNEPNSISGLSNGYRIYIGDKNTVLPAGVYTYTINYETTDQLGFFDDHDELYWNVTGNGWDFPIDRASVIVSLPGNVDSGDINAVGYLGPSGSTEPNREIGISNSRVMMSSSRSLDAGEGMTIAVKFPKDVVTPPPAYRKYIPDWLVSMQSLGGILLFMTVGIYYYIVWRKKGRDERQGPVVPVLFEPPKGLTPAEVRFLDKVGEYDTYCLSSAIMNMAVNGYIQIKQDGEVYKLIKTSKDPSALVNEEEIIYRNIFRNNGEEVDIKEALKNALPESAPGVVKFVESQMTNIVSMFRAEPDLPGTFTIKRSNCETLQRMELEVREYFSNVKKKTIISNRSYLLLALIPLALFFVFNFLYLVFNNPASTFFVLFASFWNSIVSVFVAAAAGSWVQVLRNKNYKLLPGALFMTMFLTPFIAVGAFVGSMAFSFVGYLGLLGTIVLIYIYYKALPKRTKEAGEAQDKIDGFKQFLVSQEDYVKGVQMDLPSKFSMYEKYLPYAIALDVEPQWSAKFRDTVSEMARQGMSTDTGWYVGSAGVFAASAFSMSDFNSSFATSISSASTNPSSGSGFSGGSSGGGGGGGGGGGW